MRFFATRYPDESVRDGGIRFGRFFITGDRSSLQTTERFTVRVVTDDARVLTVGSLCEHPTADAAHEAILRHMNEGRVVPYGRDES